MKKRRHAGWLIALFLCVLAVASGSSVASQETDQVPWSADRPLVWDDFQGKPPVQAQDMMEAAQIHMTIRWQLQLTMEYDCQLQLWTAIIDRPSLTVVNTMVPASSWVDRSRQNSATLNHEQGHFDLNEVYRRKLQAALAPLTVEGGTADAAKQALQALIDVASEKVMSQLANTQASYDRGTRHGTDLQAQTAWNNRIEAWLANPNQAP